MGPVGVVPRRMRAVLIGRDQGETNSRSAHARQLFGAVDLDNRHGEERTGAGPYTLRVVGISAVARHQQRTAAKRVAGAKDGADVARVGGPIQHRRDEEIVDRNVVQGEAALLDDEQQFGCIDTLGEPGEEIGRQFDDVVDAGARRIRPTLSGPGHL